MEAPWYTDINLAMSPADARRLRTLLSRAINADQPVILAVQASAAGPDFRVLTVNESALDAWRANSRRIAADVVKGGQDVTLEAPDFDPSTRRVLVDGQERAVRIQLDAAPVAG
jgi:hypothetical protein